MTKTKELFAKAKSGNYKSHQVKVTIEEEVTSVDVLLKKVTLQDLLKYTNKVPHLYNLLTGVAGTDNQTPEDQLEQTVGMIEVMKTLITVGVLDPESKSPIFDMEDSEDSISPDILGIEGINSLGLEVLSFSGFRS